ncbi:hypothetical protein [Klebsiella pneumoniae]
MLIEYLAKILLLEADFILKVANDANSHYGKFSVPKKAVGQESSISPLKN